MGRSTTQDDIETGIEQDSDVARETAVDADWYAYIDDGEHAYVDAIERTDDTTIHVETILCEAGLAERDGDAVEYDVDADKATREIAREFSENDPELSIELAQEFWNNW